MASTTLSFRPSKSRIQLNDRDFRRSGFSLVELLVVLIVGSVIIAALTTTVISVLKGSSGLTHYADMKAKSDRLIFSFEQDVVQATRIDFITPASDEVMAFDLYNDSIWIAGYSFGVDSSPPQGLDSSQTWYSIYRHPNGGSRYELANGLSAPPSMSFSGYSGNPVSSFFFFLDAANNEFNHESSEGQARAENGATKIRVNGTMQRGGRGDYTLTHEVSSLTLLKRRVTKNSSL